MKEDAISKATNLTDATVAKGAWSKLKTVCFGGAEPTTEGLRHVKEDDMKAAKIPPVIASAWAAMFKGESGKATKFKPTKVYTPIQYAQFYAQDPKNDDLLRVLAVTSEGKPWVIAPGGKFHVEKSAYFLNLHIEDEIAPATVDVDGVPITPCHPGEELPKKEAKLRWVDPHTPGGFLDATMTSPRTGASFAAYVVQGESGEDATRLSAMIFLCERDLHGESVLSLKRHAEENAGKTASEILSPFKATFALWNKDPKGRPDPKRAKGKPELRGDEVDGGFEPFRRSRPFDETPAPSAPAGGSSDAAPLFLVLNTVGNGEAWAKVKTTCALLVRQGKVRVVSDSDISAGQLSADVLETWMTEAAIIGVLTNAAVWQNDNVLQLAERARRSGANVVPLIVGAVREGDTSGTVLSGRAIPHSYKPMRTEEDFSEVSQELREMLATYTPRPRYPQRPSLVLPDRNDIIRALVQGGVSPQALTAGMDGFFVMTIGDANSPITRISSILESCMNCPRLADGSRPFVTFLKNGIAAMGQRTETAVLETALRVVTYGPAWLDLSDFPFRDKDASAFYQACQRAFSHGQAEQICNRIPMFDRHSVNFYADPAVVWSTILTACAKKGRLRDLFLLVLNDRSKTAHFRPW